MYFSPQTLKYGYGAAQGRKVPIFSVIEHKHSTKANVFWNCCIVLGLAQQHCMYLKFHLISLRCLAQHLELRYKRF